MRSRGFFRAFIKFVWVGVLSVLSAAVLLEGGLRMILDPYDYLIPRRVKDPNLVMRIPPHAGSHDAWGFRNRNVPDKVDIVTIGDRMTYGVTVPARHSWPAQLSHATGKTVYNAATGGWSVFQYLCVLERHAVQLKPKTVVFGIYMGTDVWEGYRNHNFPCPKEVGTPHASNASQAYSTGNSLESLLVWFKVNSVAFQWMRLELTGISDFFGNAMGTIFHPSAMLRLDTDKVKTNFRKGALRDVSLDNEEVKGGVDVMGEFFDRSEAVCRQHDIDCYYLLLPTKEAVYEPMLLKEKPVPGVSKVLKVAQAEMILRDKIYRIARKSSARILDPLPGMQMANGIKQLYLKNKIHPDKHGFEVIALEVAQRITPPDSRVQVASTPEDLTEESPSPESDNVRRSKKIAQN